MDPVTGELLGKEKTPNLQVNNSQRLGDYIRGHADLILSNHYKIPQEYPDRDPGVPAERKCGEGIHIFRGSSVRVDPDNSFWQSPSLPLDTVQNRRLRHQFSLNTCNGCHGRETGSTGRFHIFPRLAGQESQLSNFLSGLGSPVGDPAGARDVDGNLIRRNFDDLNRRRVDLSDWLCNN